VNSGLDLGTTEPNLTQPKLSEPHPALNALAPPSEARGEGVSSSVVDGYFEQAKKGMAEAAVEEKPTPAPSPLVDDLVKRLGMVKPLDPNTYGEWTRRLEALGAGVGEAKYAKAIAYVFENPMYSRGIKTTKQDKVDWLCAKYESILAKMDADAEFASKKPTEQDNRPEYLKNPTGGVKFSKSVV